MDKKYLYQRHNAWWVQVRVPPSVQHILGKKQLYRNLFTTDLNKAAHLKYSAVGELKAQIAEAKKSQNHESTKEEQLLAAALSLKEQKGDPDIASEILEHNVYEILGNSSADSIFNYPCDDGKTDLIGSDPVGVPKASRNEEEQAFKLEETVKKAFKIISEDSYTISQAATRFLEEESRRIKKSTLVRKKKRIGEFIRWFGDDLIKNVSKESAGSFVTEYVMPQQLASSTNKAFVLDLKTFFSFSRDRGMIENNPFEKLTSTIKKSSTSDSENKREAWTEVELELLLSSLNVKDNLWPLSAIALYSGMRIDEICSMEIKYVRDGLMNVRGGKTDAAIRVVPIHPIISPLIDRLTSQSTDGFLLSGLKSGGYDNKHSWNIQKRFGRFKSKLGMPKSKVFHCFRKNFCTALENLQVPENIAQQLVGHSKKSLTYALYSQGASVDILRETVNRICFGEIDEMVSRISRI
jgi:integrase